jgi:hypothetical protein
MPPGRPPAAAGRTPARCIARVQGVVDQPRVGTPVPDGHVEGVEDELGAEVVGHRPADHPTRVDIQDDGQIQPARPGRDVGDVSRPDTVGCGRSELAVDQVRSRRGPGVASGQAPPPAPVAADEPGGPHQPGHPLAAYLHTVVQPQLGMDPWGTIGGPAASMDRPDLLSELLVDDRSSRRWPALPGVEARARHTQHAAQPGDSVVCLLLLDQPELHRR